MREFRTNKVPRESDRSGCVETGCEQATSATDQQAASEFTCRPGETWGSYVTRRARLFGREREAGEVFRRLAAEHGPEADDALLVAADD